VTLVLAVFILSGAHAQSSEPAVEVANDPILGAHLVDARGNPLYVRGNESMSDIVCTGSCLDDWQPFVPVRPDSVASDALQGDLSAFERSDGERQFAYRGRPLYQPATSEARFEAARQADDMWFVANVTPVARTNRHPSLGEILVGPTGMTLYTFGRDPDGGYECDDACAQNFPPLVVADASQAAADLPAAIATIPRAPEEELGPRLQVTYRGRPLYYWSRDASPGDAGGHGIAGHWEVARP
jgi:predicted lipoprotein with Yx(FWY)xxD motif